LSYERLDTGPVDLAIAPPDEASARIPFVWSEDVVMQAVTRGKRDMDEQLAKEASRKDTTKKAGDVMETLGSFIPYGELLQFGGQAVRGVATKTKAFADTRSLRNLSSDLAVGFFRPGDIPEGSRIEITDDNGAVVASGPIPAINQPDKPTVVLVRYWGKPSGTQMIAAATDEAGSTEDAPETETTEVSSE
jgi:hypothetical protein